MQKLLKIAEEIFREKGMPGLDDEVTAYYANYLWNAIVEGYGMDLPASPLDWETPDAEMLLHLKKNVYQFSAAKNFQQMRALTDELVDQEGKLRTRTQFFNEAFRINKEHVVSWLDAERDLAIGSSQMASKWKRIQEDIDVLPYLEFDVVMDESTSDICKPLNGIIRRADDPIFDIYYPPNHFRCRTTIRQHANADPTPIDQITWPDIPKMFKVNAAKRQLAFPPEHPYWKNIPKKDLDHALQLMPYDEQFEILERYKTGFVRKHIAVDQTAKDYAYHLRIARDKMMSGSKVDIMPIIEKEIEAVRKIIFPDAKGNTNADLRIDGILAEVKVPTKNRVQTIHHAINSASSQADHVIIYLEQEISVPMMERLAKGRFSQLESLQLIEFVLSGKSYEFSRSSFK